MLQAHDERRHLAAARLPARRTRGYDCREHPPRKNPMHAYHDLGGTPAGPIDQDEHPAVLWEKRVEALLALVRKRGLLSTDENRRALESLGAEVYHRLTYAERRTLALSNNMIAKGVFTIDELAAKMAEVEQRRDVLP
jgi:hypothetical protein